MTESVGASSVTTLVGPGGVGKTALATSVAAACAADFPDGVVVVWLAALSSADLVAGEVAAQVGLARSGGQSYEDALIRWLSERDVLLVLDNCEHVLSATADLVDALTARLPRLRVLATSREPLWVEGEVSYRLAPLPVAAQGASLAELSASPAVVLFQERAGARTRGSVRTERESLQIGDICRKLDGLPLAIELAAARVAGLELQDISLHLDDLFALLPQVARRADGVQRSLRATVEWSDALLTAEERRLLRRMAVFAGGFDLAAAKAVCLTEGQTAAQIADLAARLVEKSLLIKLEGGRYQLLETIRQYSVEQLRATGELDGVRDRHARVYCEAALQHSNAMFASPERPHLEALARLEDNVRIALERLLQIDSPAALQLGSAMTNFWWVQGKLREGIGWLEQARKLTADAPAELRATGYFCEGFLIAHDTDDWFAAAKLLDVGLEIMGDPEVPPPILGMLHCLRGECDVFNGFYEAGVERTERGLALSAAYPGTWVRGFCLWNAAYAKRGAGDIETSIALFTQSIELSIGYGAALATMCGCHVMGEIWETRGDLVRARSFYEDTLRYRKEIGGHRMGYVHGSMPESLLCIARVASKQGELALAAQLLHEALPLAEEMRAVALARQIVELGDRLGAASPAKAPQSSTAVLRPEAGVWHITFNGKSVHVPDFKGLWHLRELVSRPREAVSALTLIGAASEEPLPMGDAGPTLDREALKQYRKRLARLDEQMEQAEAQHDAARHAKRSAEREALLAELARATGLGGKPRRTGSAAEKARLNVTRTIRHAVAYLATALPELAEHLDESLATGISCCYEPRTDVSWST